MIGGLVESADTLLRSFPQPRLSAEARVEPAEEQDDPHGWNEPGAKGGCRHGTHSLVEDFRETNSDSCTQALMRARGALREGVILSLPKQRSATMPSEASRQAQGHIASPVQVSASGGCMARFRHGFAWPAPRFGATISPPCPPQRFFLQPAVPEAPRAGAR